jgi:hypothetical protein
MLAILLSYLIKSDIKEVNLILKIVYLVDLYSSNITGKSLFNLNWFIEKGNLGCDEIISLLPRINKNSNSRLPKAISLALDIVLATTDYDEEIINSSPVQAVKSVLNTQERVPLQLGGRNKTVKTLLNIGKRFL